MAKSFAEELVPVSIPQKKGNPIIEKDEHPRPETPREKQSIKTRL